MQIAEVTVDTNTGKIRVDQITSVHDSGTIINPQMARGQVYGGTTQAMGFTITEQLGINEQGILRAGTMLEYKMPTTLEMPEFAVDFVETNDPHGPYGAKCIAEPPIYLDYAGGSKCNL